MVYILTLGVYWWQMLPYIAYMDPWGNVVLRLVWVIFLWKWVKICHDYTLINKQFAIENGPVETVSFLIKNGGSFHSYVNVYQRVYTISASNRYLLCVSETRVLDTQTNFCQTSATVIHKPQQKFTYCKWMQVVASDHGCQKVMPPSYKLDVGLDSPQEY